MIHTGSSGLCHYILQCRNIHTRMNHQKSIADFVKKKKQKNQK